MADRSRLSIILLLTVLGLILVNPGGVKACEGRCRVGLNTGSADICGLEIFTVNYHPAAPKPLSPPPCRCLPDPSWSERAGYNYWRTNAMQNPGSPVSHHDLSTPGLSTRQALGVRLATLPLFLFKSSLLI